MGFYMPDPNRTMSQVSPKEKITVVPYNEYSYSLRRTVLQSRMVSFVQPKTGKGKTPYRVTGYAILSNEHLTSLYHEARARGKEAKASKIMRVLLNRQARKRKKDKGIPHDRKLKPLSCYHEKVYAEQVHWDDYPVALPAEYNPYKPGMIYTVPGGQPESPQEPLMVRLNNLNLEEIVQATLDRLTYNIQPRAKDLIPFAINFFQQLVEFSENLALPGAIKNGYKKLLRNGITGDTAAEAWLTANWGVLPLLSDANEFHQLLTTIRESVINWNSNLTRVLFRRRRRARIPLENLLRPTTTTHGGTNTSYVRRNIKYNAYLDVYYAVQFYPEPIQDSDMLGIIADRFGFMKPLSGLWEGVPWSWLIDYAVDVGGWLDSKEPEFQLPFRVETRIESIKFVCTESCELNFASSFTGQGKNISIPNERFCRYEFYRRLVKIGTIKHYSALVWQPKVSLSLGKGLNAKRLANIAAVIQKNTSSSLSRRDRKFLKSVKRAKYFTKISKRAAQKNMKIVINS